MGRWWNQVKSVVYTRLPWLTHVYVRAARGGWEETIPLPPLAPPRKPATEATVALLTTAGVHLHSQASFDMLDPEGDATFRVIPGDVQVADLTITHDYYDHAAADRDINCVFPIERLRELEAAGTIASVAPRHVAFMGHILGARRDELVERTADEIAALFWTDRVDTVLASPG